MGIKGFYGEWIRNRVSQCVVRNLPNGRPIHTLMFDCNGLIHKCAQEVYAYDKGYQPARRANVERTLLQADGESILRYQLRTKILNEFVEVITRLQAMTQTSLPIRQLIICVDGVAPFAKITQQRTRRYRSIEMSSDVTRQAPNGWASAAISPGTQFMIELHAELQAWFASVETRSLIVDRLVYSGFNLPGEGEHKMFELFRRQMVDMPTDESISVIYGLDADLILLSSLSPINNLYLCREEFDNLVYIDEFRVQVCELMSPGATPDYKYLRDFVCLMNFVGNDFLHRLMCFADLANSLDLLIQLYRAQVELNSEFYLVDENGQINLTFILLTLQPLIEQNYERQVFTNKIQERRQEDYGNYVARFNDVRAFEVGSSYVNGKLTIASKTLREVWYHDILGFVPENLELAVQQLCHEYWMGVQFVLHYYLNGPSELTNEYAYQWTQAPLLQDLYTYGQIFIEQHLSPLLSDVSYIAAKSLPRLSVYQQLVAILPPQLKWLLPLEYSMYSTSWYLSEPLVDLFPYEYTVDYQGRMAKYEGIARLPALSMSRLLRSIPLENYSLDSQPQIEEGQATSSNFRPNNRLFMTRGNIPRGGRGNIPRGSRGGEFVSRGSRGNIPHGGRGNVSQTTPHGSRGNIPRGGRGNIPQTTTPRGANIPRGERGNIPHGSRGNFRGRSTKINTSQRATNRK